MRIGLRSCVLVTAAFAAIVLRPWSAADPPPAMHPAPPRAVPAERVLAWQVLSPRHRGTSPAPLLVFMTPGWLGPVEAQIETRTRSHVVVTRARGLPWPAALPPLAIGEWCTATITGPHGRSAEAAYVRARAPAMPAGALEVDWMACGFPAVARLRGGLEMPLANLRAGVAPLPEMGGSDTMPRAREK